MNVCAAAANVPTPCVCVDSFAAANVPTASAGTVVLLPVKVCAAAVREMLAVVGVTLSLPPVVPTSPAATVVARTILPAQAVSSVQPSGHVPVSRYVMSPAGTDPATAAVFFARS